MGIFLPLSPVLPVAHLPAPSIEVRCRNERNKGKTMWLFFSTRTTLTIQFALLLVISATGLARQPAAAQEQGMVQIRGLIGPVTIERDADGVAHIRAGGEVDAHFGLGYAHAQDRL